MPGEFWKGGFNNRSAGPQNRIICTLHEVAHMTNPSRCKLCNTNYVSSFVSYP